LCRKKNIEKKVQNAAKRQAPTGARTRDLTMTQES
jgi:hypothetical protein